MRSNPISCTPFLSLVGLLGRRDDGVDNVRGNTDVVHHHGIGVPSRLEQLFRPDVLERDKHRGTVGLQVLLQLLGVLGAERAGLNDVDPQVARPGVGINVRRLDGRNYAVSVLADEQQIDDADRGVVNQLHQRRSDAAAELVARKPDNHHIYWAEPHNASSSSVAAGSEWPGCAVSILAARATTVSPAGDESAPDHGARVSATGSGVTGPLRADGRTGTRRGGLGAAWADGRTRGKVAASHRSSHESPGTSRRRARKSAQRS